MGVLIVKEDMRTKCRENIFLADATEEECLVHTNIPVPKGLDGPLMGRRISGRYQSGSNWSRLFIRKLGLNMRNGSEKVGERPLFQRNICIALFMFCKSIQSPLLVDFFRIRAKENGISVKGDPNLLYLFPGTAMRASG